MTAIAAKEMARVSLMLQEWIKMRMKRYWKEQYGSYFKAVVCASAMHPVYYPWYAPFLPPAVAACYAK